MSNVKSGVKFQFYGNESYFRESLVKIWNKSFKVRKIYIYIKIQNKILTKSFHKNFVKAVPVLWIIREKTKKLNYKLLQWDVHSIYK
jgi:hypothetical protein